MAVDTTWVKNRIGDEMGLTEDDLARLYGVETKGLDAHLRTIAKASAAVYEKVLADLDAVRVGYRVLEISDDHIAATRALLRDFIFRPLVSMPMADGQIGWRLSSDDAQFVAFRAADIVGMDFERSDVLRLRLKRLVVWPDEAKPDIDQAFRDRVADITFYLAELTGVL